MKIKQRKDLNNAFNLIITEADNGYIYENTKNFNELSGLLLSISKFLIDQFSLFNSMIYLTLLWILQSTYNINRKLEHKCQISFLFVCQMSL